MSLHLRPFLRHYLILKLFTRPSYVCVEPQCVNVLLRRLAGPLQHCPLFRPANAHEDLARQH